MDLRVLVQRFALTLLPLCTKWDIHPVRQTLTCGWKPWLDQRIRCISTLTFYAMMMTYCAYTMTQCQLWKKLTAIYPWNPVLRATLTFILVQSWKRLDYPMGQWHGDLVLLNTLFRQLKIASCTWLKNLPGDTPSPLGRIIRSLLTMTLPLISLTFWTLTVLHSISILLVWYDGWLNLNTLTLQLMFQCYLHTWHAHARATLRTPCMSWDIYNWSITHASYLTQCTLTLTRLPFHPLNGCSFVATWKKQFLPTCLLPLAKTLTFVWW